MLKNTHGVIVKVDMKTFRCIALSFFVLIAMNAKSNSYAEGNFPLSGLRGINVSLNRGVSESDMQKLHDWGVNLVRLVINADPSLNQYDHVFGGDGKVSKEFFNRLDVIVKVAQEKNIKLIIDMHTFPGYQDGKVWTDKAYWTMLLSLWKEVATHYSGNKVIVGYDLINEPNLLASLSPGPERSRHFRDITAKSWKFPQEWRSTARDYFLLVTQIAEEINKVDAEKAIIVEGVGIGGRASNFYWMEPIKAKNVVYSFHTYVPKEFGDSGKNSNASNVSYDSKKQKTLLESDIYPVQEFARRFNADIYVGEFGLTYYSEGKGAREWIQDMVSLFEQNNWPWTYWSYSIDLRSPEIVMTDNAPKKTNASERLSALKAAWKKNQ